MFPYIYADFQKEEVFVFFSFCFSTSRWIRDKLSTQKHLINPWGDYIRWTLQKDSLDFKLFVSQDGEWHTKRVLSLRNRSDNCQIIARIWQLNRSLQQIKREMRTIWCSLRLWHPISPSNRDRNPPSLCRWLILWAYTVIFRQKNTCGELKTEGALKMKHHLLCAVKACLT